MATTTVRGAGRAKHKANERHQQRTPMPARGSTAAAEAKAILAEEVAKVMKPERVSKAQQLALAAEENGWDVERIMEGSHKTLIATRGDETLEANWENDRSCVPLGWHTIGGNKSKFQHVTVAIKIISVDPEVAASNAATASASKKAPKAVTHRSLSRGVPYNAAVATDDEIMEAIRGREITWTNVMSGGEVTGIAVVPEKGKQTKMTMDDLDDLSTRQLTFCDAAGSGYYTVRLSQITGVGALKDAGGHLLTDSMHRGMMAMQEGNRKARSA